jgi:hypothetical protein
MPFFKVSAKLTDSLILKKIFGKKITLLIRQNRSSLTYNSFEVSASAIFTAL